MLESAIGRGPLLGEEGPYVFCLVGVVGAVVVPRVLGLPPTSVNSLVVALSSVVDNVLRSEGLTRPPKFVFYRLRPFLLPLSSLVGRPSIELGVIGVARSPPLFLLPCLVTRLVETFLAGSAYCTLPLLCNPIRLGRGTTVFSTIMLDAFLLVIID